MKLRAIAILGLLATFQAVHAQVCDPPHPFDRTSAINGTVQLAAGSGTSCDIVASVAANSSTGSGALAWYSLPSPAVSWRISFHLDTSQFDANAALNSVDILSAMAPKPAVEGGQASLLRLTLLALGGPNVMLLASGACGDARCTTATYGGELVDDLVSGDLLRFELDTGDGTAGQLKWWVNADFTDPPTGTFDNLDNVAWQGVQYVALGAFQPTYQSATSGTTLQFSGIDSPYDILFWSDLDE